jgi:hypothetical protein
MARLNKLLPRFVTAQALTLSLCLMSSAAAEQNSNTEECATRAAIAASIAKIESERPAAPASALLAQIDAIEDRVSNLQFIMSGACGDNLDNVALRVRIERARDAIHKATAEERRRKEEQAEQQRRRRAEQHRQQAEESRRGEIAAKPWPEPIKQAVLDRSVEIGMTREQVAAAWGRPNTINETIRATSREEQWVYPGSSYLYFRNGTLTTIQRTR